MSKITAEIAYNYVYYGIKSTNFTRNKCLSFLFIIIILGIIAILLCSQKLVIILVAISLALNLIVSLICYNKWSAKYFLVSQATYALVVCIIIDLIYYAMYQATSLLVWQDYLVAMILQVAAIPIVAVFTVFHAKTFKEKKYSTLYKIGSAISGTVYGISSIVCKIFLTDASLSVVLTIISILINIIVFFLIYAILNAIYRAFLIGKFNLSIEVA